MNFRKVLENIIEFFDRKKIRFAVIGAFGLQAYGLSRMTRDVDFVAEKSFRDDIVSFLESLGYKTLYVSSGYSNHIHGKEEMGRLDFVYVEGKTAELLFSGSRIKLFSKNLLIPVPKPEHIAAMKIFAMKNDPSREYHEMADLQFLLSLPGIDREEIKGYFKQYGMTEKYEELERKIKKS